MCDTSSAINDFDNVITKQSFVIGASINVHTVKQNTQGEN